MKKIKTMKLLKNGMIRFVVNNVNFNDRTGISQLCNEISERLTKKYNRDIYTFYINVSRFIVLNGDEVDISDLLTDCKDDVKPFFSVDTILHLFQIIGNPNGVFTSIVYDPICGNLYIETE